VTDATAISAVHCRSWYETYPGLLPDRIIDARTKIGERIVQWDRGLREPEPQRIAFVNETNGKIDGFILVAPSDPATLRRHPGYADTIYALYVLAGTHGRGVGRHLIYAAMRRMVATGRFALCLDVLASSPARHFYEHLGAQQISTTTITDGDDAWEQCRYGWSDIRRRRDRPQRPGLSRR
jgi:GNAT superfamily N-acetyltransferase